MPPMAEANDALDARGHKITNTQVFTTLLRMLSSMMLIPVQPKIIQGLAATDGSWTYASYSSTVQFAGALVQLAVLPYAGALSDRLFGRKPPLLACGAVQLVYMVALKLAEDHTITLTTLVAVAVAQVASSYISMAITSAALGDAWAHAPEKLAAASGKLGGIAFGVGMLVGPGLGAAIGKVGGPDATLYAAMACSCCAILTQALLMTECAPLGKGKGEDGKGGSLGKALKGVSPLAGLDLIFRSGGVSLRALGLVMMLHGLTKGEQAIYMPFMLSVWKVESSGIAVAMTVVGLIVATSQAVLAKPLVARLGSRGALVVGLGAATVQRAAWAVFTTPAAMGAAMALGSPGLTADAFARQLATEYWTPPKDEPEKSPPQGEISAALTGVSTLAVLLSSPIIGRLFSEGKERSFPGLPFAFGACCCLVSMVVLLAATPADSKSKGAEEKKTK